MRQPEILAPGCPPAVARLIIASAINAAQDQTLFKAVLHSPFTEARVIPPFITNLYPFPSVEPVNITSRGLASVFQAAPDLVESFFPVPMNQPAGGTRAAAALTAPPYKVRAGHGLLLSTITLAEPHA